MKKTNGFAGLLMAAMLLLSGGAKAQASIPQIVADTLRANHPAPYTNITKEAFDAQAEALAQNRTSWRNREKRALRCADGLRL